MKSAIRVSRVYLSVLSCFVAATLFIGASALPAHTSIGPTEATGTGTVEFTLSNHSDPNWSLGLVDHSDDGGNYSYAYAGNPWGVNCTVVYHSTPKTRDGESSFTQHFIWNGDPNSPGELVFDTCMQASAYFASPGQKGYGEVTDITSGGMTEAKSVSPDTPVSSVNIIHYDDTPMSVDYTEKVKTVAAALTP